MATGRIGWGVLGTGTVARDFARDLRFVPGADLTGVASRTSARAETFARRLGVHRAFSTRDELVQQPEVDVVYVATTPDHHADDAIACLRAGKHVLCEKPFAINASQTREVIRTARENRRFCMEAMWMRFIPLVGRVRDIVRSGEVGEVRMITADFSLPTKNDSGAREFDPRRGGGALLERGVYGISLAHWLLGEPTSVSGGAAIGETGVDEQNAAILSYPSGALAVLTSGLRTRGTNEARILGTRGSVRMHEFFFRPERISLSSWDDPPPSPDPLAASGGSIMATARESRWARTARALARRWLPTSGTHEIVQGLRGKGYNYEASEVMRCLREGLLESPDMRWEDSIRVMETLDSLRSQWSLRYPAEEVA